MSERTEIPIDREPLLHVDLTPGPDLPLRILRAYRQRCDCRWHTSGLAAERARIYEIMNRHQVERAAALDAAIALLEVVKEKE